MMHRAGRPFLAWETRSPELKWLFLQTENETRRGRAGIMKATGYDRGAFGRNSKVLKGWARAQINVAPATPDNNAQIVIASGKCNNFEEFAPISARLNPGTLLYELVPDFDFEAWQESHTGIMEKATTGKVIEILNAGGMEKNAAIVKLKIAGIGRDKASELIAKGVTEVDIEEIQHPRTGKKPAVSLSLKS